MSRRLHLSSNIHRFFFSLILGFVTTTGTLAFAQSTAIDRFDTGTLSPQWIPFDSNFSPDDPSAPLEWGPGQFLVEDGNLTLTTSGPLPVLPSPADSKQFAGLLGTVWSPGLADPVYSNGTLSGIVRAGADSNTDLLLRVNPETGSSYVMTGLGSFGEFHFSVIENNILTRDEVIPQVNFTTGEDWNMEFTTIDNRISMKAWKVGDDEPERPQLTLFDDALTMGAPGLSASVSSTNISEPTPVHSTFDDIVFTPANHVVSPRQFEQQESVGNNSVAQPLRFQQVFDAGDFDDVNGAHTITEIRWRPDGNNGVALDHVIDGIRFNMSVTDRGPGGLSNTFADNMGSDPVEIYAGALDIKSENVESRFGTAEFDILVPLQTPFVYDPADGNLLLDISIEDNRYLPSFQDGFATTVLASSMIAMGDPNAISGRPVFGGLVTQFTLSPQGISDDADINGDGLIDASDIDELTTAIQRNDNESRFDVDKNGIVDAEDRDHWVTDLANTWIGDSNLDGRFDSTDLVEVFRAAEYEDGVPENSTWATGDWNGDWEFDSSDFIAAFQSGGYEVGQRQATLKVPEPASAILLWVLGLGAARRCLRK